MKKITKILTLFSFMILAMVSLNMKTAYAATGDRTTPYSAWNLHEFTVKPTPTSSSKVIVTQLADVESGSMASAMLAYEGSYFRAPAADEQWIILLYVVGYESGPNVPLNATDLISSKTSFYTAGGQLITPISTVAFKNSFKTYDQYNVKLYPGHIGTVAYGILVKKTAGYPLVRIGTGYDAYGKTTYKWFATSPSYFEANGTMYANAISNSYNSISVQWQPSKAASGYEIYRATSSNGAYTKVATVGATSTSYINTLLNTNTTYYYKVRAYKTGATTTYTSFSSVVSAKPVPSVPTNFKAARASSTGIKLTWSAVAGATGYEVYRSTSSTGTYSYLGATSSLYYNNTGLKTGVTYYYKIRAYRTVGTTKVYSMWTTVTNARTY